MCLRSWPAVRTVSLTATLSVGSLQQQTLYTFFSATVMSAVLLTIAVNMTCGCMSLHFNALSGLTQTCLTAYLTQYLHGSRHFIRLCISVHSWEVHLRFDLPRKHDARDSRITSKMRRCISNSESGNDVTAGLAAAVTLAPMFIGNAASRKLPFALAHNCTCNNTQEPSHPDSCPRHFMRRASSPTLSDRMTECVAASILVPIQADHSSWFKAQVDLPLFPHCAVPA